VRPCGAGLCAVIAAPKSAVDPETGRPWTDRHNHDPALRGRALVGVPVRILKWNVGMINLMFEAQAEAAAEEATRRLRPFWSARGY
jgi:hypothetical protein